MKTMRNKMGLILSTRGFSLIEVMLAMSVAGIAMATFLSFGQFSSDYQNKVITRNTLFQVKADILRNVDNKSNWAKMISTAGVGEANLNPELACIRNGTACSKGPHTLTLLTADGRVYLDSNDKHKGFTKEGTACSTFGSGSGTCSNRYKVTWNPICPPTGPCVSPQIAVKVGYESSASNVTTQASNTNKESAGETSGGRSGTDETSTGGISGGTGGQSTSGTDNKDGISELNVSSTIIEQPRTQPPVVRPKLTYANSRAPAGLTGITFENIAPLDGVSNAELVENPSGTTAKGGTYNAAGSIIRYTPEASFYGTDSFSYRFRDTTSGKLGRAKVTVRVMTPYTWTGMGNPDAGVRKSTTLKNFCGKVIAGQCNGTTFPSGNYHRHVIFNETCTNCDATLNGFDGSGFTQYHTIELTPAYSGTVKATGSFNVSDSQSSWDRPFNVMINGGTFDASGASSMTADGYFRRWMYTPPWKDDYAMRVSGAGRMIAPAGTLRLNGAVYIESPAHFVHNNGLVWFSGLYGRNRNIYMPGVELYNARFGGGLGMNIASNFTVWNELHVAPQNAADDRLGTGHDPVTGANMPQAVVSVKGNLKLSGAGGSHCDGGGNQCLPPLLTINGTGEQQIIGAADTAALPPDSDGFAMPLATTLGSAHGFPSFPAVVINKEEGRVTMSGGVGLRRDFRIIKISDYDFSNSKLVFNGTDCSTQMFVPGTATEFGDFYEAISWCAGNLNVGAGNVNVKNFFHIGTDQAKIWGNAKNSMVFNVSGNVYYAGSHAHDATDRAAMLRLVGNSNQKIARLPAGNTTTRGWNMIMNIGSAQGASGTITLEGIVGTWVDFDVSGTSNFIAPAGSVFFTGPHGWNTAKTQLRMPETPGIMGFDRVEIGHNTELISDLRVKDLQIGLPGSDNASSIFMQNGKNIFVKGDLEMRHTHASTGQLNISMTGGGKTGSTPYVEQKVIFNPLYSISDAGNAATYNGSWKKVLNISVTKPAGARVLAQGVGLAAESTPGSILAGINKLCVDTGTFKLDTASIRSNRAGFANGGVIEETGRVHMAVGGPPASDPNCVSTCNAANECFVTFSTGS